MSSSRIKIITYAPSDSTKAIIRAMGQAGAGKIGNYNNCAFITHGTGTWYSGEGANPSIGAVGKTSRESEDKIEMTCDQISVAKIVQAIKESHPYETPAIDIYPLAPLPG